MTDRMHRRRFLVVAFILLGLLVLFVGRSTAHGGGVSGVRSEVTPPAWLMVLTGGSVIGASFLLTSFVTDRDLVDSVHSRGVTLLSLPNASRGVAKLLGFCLFAMVIGVGLLGPKAGVSNPAVIIVWVGWWGGYVTSVYLVGDSWPTLNPVRLDWDFLSNGHLSYPTRLGCWPATFGLLGIALLESASSVSENPRMLGGVVAGYLIVTIVGSAVFGSETWFEQADPLSNLFHFYGSLAPIQPTESGVTVRLPGAVLRELDVDGTDEVGFLIMMLWVTTFDGLVRTRVWANAVETAVSVGVPEALVVLSMLVGGYGTFYGIFHLAAGRIRRDAPTAMSTTTLVRQFAPALVPISAGYHLAHFSPYFLSGLPLLKAAFTPPVLAPVTATPLALPAWVAGLEVIAILIGHLLAVWVAHSIALELFPGRLQALRSQYGPVAVMVGYTVVSLWIVTQPPATA